MVEKVWKKVEFSKEETLNSKSMTVLKEEMADVGAVRGE